MPISIIPQPKHIEERGGDPFVFGSETTLYYPAHVSVEAGFLRDMLVSLTGTAVHEASALDSNVRLLCGDSAERDESYVLESSNSQITLSANHPAGLFYGIQTLHQLLQQQDAEWQLPSVRIEDAPRFGWRGLHLDVGRHMYPVAFIKKFIDLMALHKFNVFHWHLTEDQGWRLEIKRYPALTDISAWRAASPVLGSNNTELDGKPYGGFYTQDEARDVVAFAKARHITVVPEIEMPGHTVAVLKAFPHLGCVGEGYEVRQFWGIEDDVFCAGTEEVYDFLENVLSEVFDIFPSDFVHIGGDECPKVRWQSCYKCQAKMEEEELHNEHELQSYFIKRMEKFINANGRRMIGWDEILEGGLAPNAAVMSWRGTQGGIDAATAGHDVVMSPTTHTYLDYVQSEDREKEPPGATYAGALPIEKVYTFNPTEGVPDDKHHHVLGGQANIWTEHMPTSDQVEYMTYPRACAVAESVWSSEEGRDFDQFKTRLAEHLKRLDRLNVNYRPLD